MNHNNYLIHYIYSLSHYRVCMYVCMFIIIIIIIIICKTHILYDEGYIRYVKYFLHKSWSSTK